MALEYGTNQQHREVVDKYVNPNADYEMTPYDFVVRPSAHLAGPITITLPRVAQARGRWYSIVCRAAGAVNTVTIQDRDDSECWPGDQVMNAKCDNVLAYSDGLKWFVFTNQTPWTTTTGLPGTATATSAAPTTSRGTTAAPTTEGQGTTAAPTTAAPTTLATTAAPTTAG